MKKILLLLTLAIPTLAFAQNAWINEFHYDNIDVDAGEFVEIVVENPASYDVSLFKIELYNGNNKAVYDTKTGDTFTQGSTNGTFTFYSYSYPSNGIQNGSPDAIALSYNGTLIQFLSYEGTFDGVGGAAAGVTSTDVGFSESNTDALGGSLQLIGALTPGTVYGNLTWSGPAPATVGTSNPITLPISLISFTGETMGESAVLNWSTASEKDNDYFDVQRSADGEVFSSIGTISGANTSQVTKNYVFRDNNPVAGTNYYKLVQHDFNGKTSASNVIAVNFKITASQLSVFPTSSDVKVTLTSVNQSNATLQLFDVNGRKLAENTVAVNKGFNTFSIPANLEVGVYFVTYASEGKTSTVKFIF